MNVQELIDKLNLIEDKTLEVKHVCPDMSESSFFGPDNLWDIEGPMSSRDSDLRIHNPKYNPLSKAADNYYSIPVSNLNVILL